MELIVLLVAEALAFAAMTMMLRPSRRANKRVGSRLPDWFWAHLRVW